MPNIMKGITKEQLEMFTKIKDEFKLKMIVPEENNWKSLTDNDIWLLSISQIIVVGGSAPDDKFKEDKNLQKDVSYERLASIQSEEENRGIINQTLRKIGTLWCSPDIYKCRKTTAIYRNLIFFKKLGPKAVLESLSEHSDREKIDYLMKNLSYIKDKGARDYLMELGFIKDAIALDTRVLDILYHVYGIKVTAKKPKDYDEIEKEILENVCKPLGLSGVQFDRMLYQKHDEIMSYMNW